MSKNKSKTINQPQPVIIVASIIILLTILLAAEVMYLNNPEKATSSDQVSSASAPPTIQNTAVDRIKTIATSYHQTHTYSLADLFVCADMSIDVWNLVKTSGINAKICAGNVDSNIVTYLANKDFDTFLSTMNHAWVLAETEPFKYLAIETTGGYVVWGETAATNEPKNNLYYSYNLFCFATPQEFKKFIDLRTQYLNICPQARQMEKYWNENIAGTPKTFENQEYKGQMVAKTEECLAVTNQLVGLLT